MSRKSIYKSDKEDLRITIHYPNGETTEIENMKEIELRPLIDGYIIIATGKV